MAFLLRDFMPLGAKIRQYRGKQFVRRYRRRSRRAIPGTANGAWRSAFFFRHRRTRLAFPRRIHQKKFPATAHRRRYGKSQGPGNLPAGSGNLAQYECGNILAIAVLS